MSTTSKTVSRGLRGILAGGLLAISAATMIALPVASAACKTVGDTINSYLERHPDLHQQLEAKSHNEGGNGNVMDYLNRHPDERQRLIDLSGQCTQ